MPTAPAAVPPFAPLAADTPHAAAREAWRRSCGKMFDRHPVEEHKPAGPAERPFGVEGIGRLARGGAPEDLVVLCRALTERAKRDANGVAATGWLLTALLIRAGGAPRRPLSTAERVLVHAQPVMDPNNDAAHQCLPEFTGSNVGLRPAAAHLVSAYKEALAQCLPSVIAVAAHPPAWWARLKCPQRPDVSTHRPLDLNEIDRALMLVAQAAGRDPDLITACPNAAAAFAAAAQRLRATVGHDPRTAPGLAALDRLILTAEVSRPTQARARRL